MAVIAVLGATGGTGVEFVRQALGAGHTIRALVRNPEKMTLRNERLQLIQGNALQAEDVEKTIEGCSSVMVTLGSADGTTCATGTENAVKAMNKFGIRRIIAVTSIGSNETKDNVSFGFSVMRKLLFENVFRDKNAQENLLRASGLDFTIVRPSRLLNGAATGKVEIDPTNKVKARDINRSDVAAICLAAIEKGEYIQQAVSVNNA